ncbi:MAG: hypothetical protein PHO07_16170, partial [Pirellulales bacterium]|nr:hypothetical protein [Pirellulales bacterium]
RSLLRDQGVTLAELFFEFINRHAENLNDSRITTKISFQNGQIRFVLPIVLDYFGNHQIVSASTASYFSCVPRNRMVMTWCG